MTIARAFAAGRGRRSGRGADYAYCDYNAGAPIRPEAAAAAARAMAIGGNPSSVHARGRAARAAVEDARDAVAALVGAAPERVVFVSGGSEANALALAGAAPRSVILSAVEHDSALAAAPGAVRVGVDRDGRIDLAALERALAAAPAPALVCVMLANNETGVVQPVAEAARLAHARGARLHCDAVQAPGRMAVDMAALGADSLSLSAHKMGGPHGAGALVLGPGADPEPLLRGGGQERGRRGGTENVPGIAGFGAAAAAVMADSGEAARATALRDRFERAIRAGADDAVIHGAAAPRLGNASCVGMAGVPAEIQVIACDLAGAAVSAGAACSSGKVAASHVLRAMGLNAAAAGEAIRVSFGWASREEDVERLCAAWFGLYERARGRRARRAA